MSDLVGKPEDRFSRVAAQIKTLKLRLLQIANKVIDHLTQIFAHQHPQNKCSEYCVKYKTYIDGAWPSLNTESTIHVILNRLLPHKKPSKGHQQ